MCSFDFIFNVSKQCGRSVTGTDPALFFNGFQGAKKKKFKKFLSFLLIYLPQVFLSSLLTDGSVQLIADPDN